MFRILIRLVIQNLNWYKKTEQKKNLDDFILKMIEKSLLLSKSGYHESMTFATTLVFENLKRR